MFVLFAARAALLTGRLPVRNGFYTTNGHARNGRNLIPDLPSSPDSLQGLVGSFSLDKGVLPHGSSRVAPNPVKCW